MEVLKFVEPGDRTFLVFSFFVRSAAVLVLRVLLGAVRLLGTAFFVLFVASVCVDYDRFHLCNRGGVNDFLDT